MNVPDWVPGDTMQFVGEVRPAATLLSREEPAEYLFGDESWTFYLHENALVIDVCGATLGNVKDLINRAKTLAAGYVHALGFQFASAHQVELQYLLCNDTMYQILSSWDELLGAGAAEPTRQVDAETIEPLTNAVFREPFLRRALADISTALEDADDTPFYCSGA